MPTRYENAAAWIVMKWWRCWLSPTYWKNKKMTKRVKYLEKELFGKKCIICTPNSKGGQKENYVSVENLEEIYNNCCCEEHKVTFMGRFKKALDEVAIK